ncbi:MAG: response regulator transcription factor [Chloroflexi bacterium]|nr:response regulator transcription factor [Chloroflexota bacterium]
MPKLRIVLADDHGVLRAGLRALLAGQPDLQVIGEAETAEAVVQLVRELRPDLALVDVRMPGGGLEATRRMRQELPDLAILILSQYDDPAYLREALAAGASGYALKRSSGHELLAAIRAVGRGEVYLHPSLARVLLEDWKGPRRKDPQPAAEPLSEREAQVLRLVALGHTTQQIAEQLFLSVRTVETYKTRGMDKLGLRGRAALVRYALEHGLLEAEPEPEPE